MTPWISSPTETRPLSAAGPWRARVRMGTGVAMRTQSCDADTRRGCWSAVVFGGGDCGDWWLRQWVDVSVRERAEFGGACWRKENIFSSVFHFSPTKGAYSPGLRPPFFFPTRHFQSLGVMKRAEACRACPQLCTGIGWYLSEQKLLRLEKKRSSSDFSSDPQKDLRKE